jgi:exopolysaccharide biosynthesis polyprenyl glycosylphosphotransferase
MKLKVRMHWKGKYLLNCVIVGSSKWSANLLDQVRQHMGFGLHITGYIGQNLHLRKKLECLGRLTHIRELVEKHGIDVVFMALTQKENTLLEDCIHACAGLNIEFYMIPHSIELMSSRIRVQEIGGVPVFKIKEAAITGWNSVFKRIFDVVFAVFVLFLTWPLFLVIALAVKIDSQGPVLYKQKRVGLDGREFDLMKFRTMTVEAETRTGPVWAQANDPRVTGVGRFLRRFSLDELPQLINVIRGEMSLVGPRPERSYFVEQFKTQVPKYLERHRVKSGMTGWAQVNGLRGNVSIEERTKYDIFYVENWSLLFDIKIILKTIGSVITGENSY